jgi:hypothetical protein
MNIKHHNDEAGNGYDPADQFEAVREQESGFHNCAFSCNIQHSLHYVKFTLHNVMLTVHDLPFVVIDSQSLLLMIG